MFIPMTLIDSFDRKACEKICRRILADLESGEELWRSKSPAYKARVAKAAEDERLAKTRAKANENASRQKKDEDNDGMAARDGDMDSSNPFNPDDPSEEFSFVGKGISQVEFDKEIQSLAWMNLPGYLIAALKRGVGIHHAGMARRYRVLVENFFRRGILKVVISTGESSATFSIEAKLIPRSQFRNARFGSQCASEDRHLWRRFTSAERVEFPTMLWTCGTTWIRYAGTSCILWYFAGSNSAIVTFQITQTRWDIPVDDYSGLEIEFVVARIKSGGKPIFYRHISS